MLQSHELRGIYVPIITPFNANGELDLESFGSLAQHLITEGIHGLVVNGTTGESPAVESNEVPLLIATARMAVDSTRQIPIVVGTGTNSTASTLQKTEQAGLHGADAALVVVPYYSRPSQQGIIEHFRSLAAAGLPVIMYDVPHRTGVVLEVNTVRTIMEMDHIIGLKDSTGSIKLVSELSRVGSKPVLCGDDEHFYASLCCGAQGGMLASAHIGTDRFVRLYQLFMAGQTGEAKLLFDDLLPLIRLLFTEPNPAPLKWLLAQRLLIMSDDLRLPLTRISTQLQQQLASLQTK
ncbi:4-hydroxy-tetrahydrodipicolinate synthase [Paenibacillus radicis (ex Xue et al. 2023)]|uniref:4-hydroxy-tetrahydrodipicolinate synthase n=1 Tax=Paenibacillus radicis (ex Xue et al. 2023) TaxID=2972489 RepID=A0ABT1YMR4_9BACL|nr:4-hydroxy-tetrahydrodipicolinate synthase [Paenibacillus radicis (ex Xue et al. 2023)]MCR8634025.1 4-hydroxy-tetrahydrodipicolinate synthase [Paenibacillus radicis (ex Xue et al. 2023)]